MSTPSAVVFGCGQKTMLSRRICPPAALAPSERLEDWNGRCRSLHDRRARRHAIDGQTKHLRRRSMGPGVATESQVRARMADCSHNIRTGLETDAIATALIDNLHCLQAKLPQHATRNDWYMALAYTVRDRMMERYIATVESIVGTDTAAKVVAYLSAELLTGPHLGNGLINLGIWQAVEDALARVHQDLSNLLEQEEEPGLGNGGLGRLAACYMDSLATLKVR